MEIMKTVVEFSPIIAVVVSLFLVTVNNIRDSKIRRAEREQSLSDRRSEEKQVQYDLKKGLVKEMKVWAIHIQDSFPISTDDRLGRLAQLCSYLQLPLFEANFDRIIILEDHVFGEIYEVHTSVRIAREAGEIYRRIRNNPDVPVSLVEEAKRHVSATASKALDAMNVAVAVIQDSSLPGK